MNVLVIGSGGREHALTWALSRSPSVENLWVAPGNPGTKKVGVNVNLDIKDFLSVYEFCRDNSIELVVVGPENPLAEGISDLLRDRGIFVLGPGKAGARLESSKSYAKEFMARHGIPHPKFWVFDAVKQACDFVRSTEGPWVIKADGLAFGKGTNICSQKEEAIEVIEKLMSGQLHGEAGKRIVIEEYLNGTELTAMALCDGNSLYPLPFAKDHKRLFEGNKGPMTGGMGAISPVPVVSQDLEKAIIRDILEKTLQGLNEEGIDFRGVIYAGLMLTSTGAKVLEYNVRFGDPESQCVLPRIEGDIARIFLACAKGTMADALEECDLGVKSQACATVVLASGGYPGRYEKGIPIYGLDDIGKRYGNQDVIVFYAGTREENGTLVTSGGRVLSVTAMAEDLDLAVKKVYEAVETIRFKGMHYRKDIGRFE